MLAGPFLGCLIAAAVIAALLPSEPPKTAARVLWEGLYGAALGYSLVMPIVILYTAPLLWLGLKLRIARPLGALAALVLPGMLLFGLIFEAGEIGTYFPAWSCFLAMLATAVIFWLSAYVRWS